MSYNAIAEAAADKDLRARCVACAAQEHKGGTNPEYWVENHIWFICARQEIADAYKYAKDMGNPKPGYDEGAITDAMILAAIQPML